MKSNLLVMDCVVTEYFPLLKAHLRAKEEERQMQQEAEKQALLEKKREEKRLQRQV